jgi:hypothetical protein
LVDIDPERFPLGTLASWQRRAITCRQQRMRTPHSPAGLDFKTGCEGAQRFLRACQNISIDEWRKSVSWISLCAMEELVRSSYPMSATNPFCAQFPHMVNLQLQMLESIRFVMKEVKQLENWIYNSDYQSYLLKSRQTFSTPQQQQTNASIEHSFMLVMSRMRDFSENSNELSSIANSIYQVIDLYGW